MIMIIIFDNYNKKRIIRSRPSSPVNEAVKTMSHTQNDELIIK
jgi:hypothetical protein